MSTIVLTGNPNTGKTTLFNALTRGHQKVGNWAGVTVDVFEGIMTSGRREFNIVDLPGISDLKSQSDDQRAAENFLRRGKYDLVLDIVDASRLSRNLFLSCQLMDLCPRMALILNMTDVAEKEGFLVDPEILSRELGIPVIPVISVDPDSVNRAKKEVLSLLDMGKSRKAEPSHMLFSDSGSVFRKIDLICDRCISRSDKSESLSDRIDKILLNRILSVPLFLLSMYMVFWFAVGMGAVFIDFFDITAAFIFIDLTGSLLHNLNAPDWLLLLTEGLGTGIQTVATFLPVVFFLFLAIGILEDLGYMARVAVITDRIMSKIGLPGNAFLPMIIGLGCTVPAVMACRTLKSRRDRFMTIFLTPFMSCGARIPVYALFCAALYGNLSGTVVFLLYLSGIVLAFLTGLILKNSIFTGPPTDFVVDLPLYHMPRPGSIIKSACNRVEWFIRRAGKVLVTAVCILTLFSSLGWDGSRFSFGDSSNSILIQTARAVSPVFEPMGIQRDNWQATVALFTGLFAKEAIVGTINSLYLQSARESTPVQESPSPAELLSEAPLILYEALKSIPDNFVGLFGTTDILGIGVVDLEAKEIASEIDTDTAVFQQIRENFTWASGYSYLLFVLLYFPCLAVVGAARQEMGGFYTALMVIYSTILAWTTATVFYQIAEGRNIIILLGAVTIFLLFCLLMRLSGKYIARDTYCTMKKCESPTSNPPGPVS